MEAKWNTKSPAVKRILQELKEIQRDDNLDIVAEALEDNIFEWHFVIRGAWDTEFEGGIYHGRIMMPAEYPFKPPAFVMLSPSGRFETGVKICLSISSFHPESWQPSWSVRSALVALIAFMQTPGGGAVGALDNSAEDRRQIAKEARATPPRHSNADRQELINRLHQKMLDSEAESRALHSVHSPPSTPTTAPALAAETTTTPAVDTTNSEEEHPETPTTPANRTAVETPASPSSSTQQNEAEQQQPYTPIDQQQQQQPVFNHQEEPLAVDNHHHHHYPAVFQNIAQSWEDRGLTYVAALLAVCILTLLVRRVLGIVRIEPDDAFFSVNPIADVEL